MADNYGSVTIQTSATLILAANTQRNSWVMSNEGAVVYFGPDASITTKGCPHLIDDGSFGEDSGGHSVYKGAVYGACTAGTSTVYYWERTGRL